MKVFLDTEFTDFHHPQLISLGLAADSGDEFYAELPLSISLCSAFVLENVVPLLGRYPSAACELADLRLKMINWLEQIRRPGEAVQICFDYQTDCDLFVNALDHRIPEWCKFQHVGRNINELLRYEYHKKNDLPEHHALYDARANRYAFRDRLPASY